MRNALLVTSLLVTLMASASAGSLENVIYRFGGIDGTLPYAGHLVYDSAGNLYGTTSYGGTFGNGEVFELSPTGNGNWTERVLYAFQGGSDGATPYAGVVFDAAGNLYGTTGSGGTGCSGIGCGTVFELTPS